MKKHLATLLMVCLLATSSAVGEAAAEELILTEESIGTEVMETVEEENDLLLLEDNGVEYLPEAAKSLQAEASAVPDVPEDAEANATGSVAINATNFPDEYFREYIETNYDRDGDGVLSQNEIALATTFEYFSYHALNSVKGIEFLYALETVHLNAEKLTSLDVSKCVNLRKLCCVNMKLTSLDVSKCTKLEVLECQDNLLTSLTIGKCAQLKTLICTGNKLVSLDLSGCPGLAAAAKTEARISFGTSSYQSDGYSISCDSDVEIITDSTPKSLSGATVKLSRSEYTYDGKAKKPAVTVILNGKTLEKGTDYKVSYKNNTEVGTATVKVTGINKYTGSVSAKFKIVSAGWLFVISGSTNTLGKGEQTTLKATVADGVTVKWSSSDKNIAKVNSKGVVTGVKPGKTTIIAKASAPASNGDTVKYKITVKKAPTEVKLNKTSWIIKPGESIKLSSTLSNGSASKLTWTTSNKKVAKVDQSGNVTAVKKGEATITVRTYNDKSATCKITVGKVKLKMSAGAWYLGYSETTTVLALPSIGNGKATYSSSNPEIATISKKKGVVTSYRKEGKTTITAKAVVGGQTVTASHELWVYGEGDYKGFTSTPLKETKQKFNARMEAIADAVAEVMKKTADKEIKKLEGGVDTIIKVIPNGMGTDAPPAEVEQEFENKLKAVIKTFDSNVSSYKDCKTEEALVKRIVEKLAGGKTGSFTFQATVDHKTGTYTVELDSNISPDGGRFMTGHIIFPDGKKYQWEAVSVSKSDIQNEMNYLKEYAEIKIEDARKAIKEDVSGLLEIDMMKKAVHKWVKGNANKQLQKQFPKVHTWLSDVDTICAKYNKVKSTLKKAKPADLTGKTGPKVIKEIAGYNRNFLDFIDLVEDLGGWDKLVK